VLKSYCQRAISAWAWMVFYVLLPLLVLIKVAKVAGSLKPEQKE
jgi:hypothetical protein